MSFQLLIATTNPGKREELLDLLSPLTLDLVFPDQLGISQEVEETGETYAENALLKAQTYFRLTGIPTLADDTGLEVEALDGNPGLHSARYIPVPGATDADRRRKLVADLAGLPRPWRAHFHCSVALVLSPNQTHLTSGDVYGEILPEEHGCGGFGYDRLFYIPEFKKTMAELSTVEKNTCSHRARAVKAAFPYLHSYITHEGV